jgi:hypothetical protein
VKLRFECCELSTSRDCSTTTLSIKSEAAGAAYMRSCGRLAERSQQSENQWFEILKILFDQIEADNM